MTCLSYIYFFFWIYRAQHTISDFQVKKIQINNSSTLIFLYCLVDPHEAIKPKCFGIPCNSLGLGLDVSFKKKLIIGSSILYRLLIRPRKKNPYNLSTLLLRLGLMQSDMHQQSSRSFEKIPLEWCPKLNDALFYSAALEFYQKHNLLTYKERHM